MNRSDASWKAWAALPAFIAIAFAAALPGALWPPGEWYASLQRPAYAPPNWVFGPVWTLLYLGIAVAGWLVWRARGLRSTQFGLWLAQLSLNALWTPLFFGLNWLGVALVEMALLLLLIALCMRSFHPVSRTASWLMFPYLLWVSFAWVLNAGFWWLNR